MKRVLVTGAASGIGREAALQIAAQGHHVVVADRNAAGAAAVVEAIRSAGGSAEARPLELGCLAQIRAFAALEVAQGKALDVLVNNAGLLPPLERATTRDGFELEFGVAHLGHFALTGQLLPALLRAAEPRVVSVSSVSHASGRIDLEDLQSLHGYTSSRAYMSTKLACLMFALELDRRAAAAGRRLVSVAAHPGIAATPIADGWEREDRRSLWSRMELAGYRLSIRLFGKTAAEGAMPIVHAATAPDVAGGGYYGPTRLRQMSGPPGRVAPSARALDAAVAAQLWERSRQLTGVSFEGF